MKKFLLPLSALLLLAGSSCTRRADNETAIRQAIERYIASRPNLNMSEMDMQVGGIRIRENTAEADVTFRSKANAEAKMSMHYTLRRHNGPWEVEPQSGGHGGMPPPGHSDTSGLPSGHLPTGSSPPPRLPSGHPPTGSSPPPEMPSGHPPTASSPPPTMPPSHPPTGSSPTRETPPSPPPVKSK